MSKKLTQHDMLEKLGKFTKEIKPIEELQAQANIAESVLLLAKINHESEYQLCYQAANHLLETVPKPLNIDQ